MAAPQRAAVLALCLLGLAARAAAQCTKGYFKLDLVSTTDTLDPIAACATSVSVNITASCKVSLKPLSSGGSYVTGIWTQDDARTYDRYLQCPFEDTDPVTPATNNAAGVQAAIEAAFEGFVYGYSDAAGTPKQAMPIDSIAYAQGKVTFTRGGTTLVYAVTESTVNPANVDPALVRPAACADLDNPVTECRDPADVGNYPEGLATVCPIGRYPLVLKDQWDVGYVSICLMCPPGTLGDGWTCSTCPAGTAEPVVGAEAGTACATQCGPGTFSPHGSSTCLPCLPGTFSDQPSNSICTECPPDSNSWLPGSITCLRCIKGIPYECKPDGNCNYPSTTTPLDPPSPGSNIVSVDVMGSCALASDYEIKAYTACSTWASGGTAGQTLQFALEVTGDCSIDVLPVTDATCAEPLSNTTNYTYGELQMRGFYESTTTIRSLLASDIPTSDFMFAIDVSGGALEMDFWAATTDPSATVQPDTCAATLNVLGGQVAGLAAASLTTCPAGSYYVPNEFCYKCPTGYTCAGGTGVAALKIPCAAETANPIYGLGTTCPKCDVANNGGYTSYDGAAYCTVLFPDRSCNDTVLGLEFNYAHKKCELCKPGTYRALEGSVSALGPPLVLHTAADDANRTCLDCPPGTYSLAGARGMGMCLPCPKGQYNPSFGLGSQEAISKVTGQHCLVCPVGSLALTDVWTSINITQDSDMPTGATYCDPCPPGTYQQANRNLTCKGCTQFPTYGVWTYRNGDATSENNECRRVPSGYKLVDEDVANGIRANSKIDLCEKGAVAFWNVAATVRTPPDPLACAPCSTLDPLLGTLKYANTYAPRQGMMSCIPVPAGNVPVDNPVTGGTDAFQACSDGQYRDAYTISASCTPCGVGREVGPSEKKDCTMCRPGTYLNTPSLNYCTECAKNYVRPTFGATSCLPCPRGAQTQDTGNTDCTSCPFGYFNGQEGTSCRPAPVGTYVNVTGAFYPLPCPRGTWNNEAGQDNCNSCPPGKYSSTLGAKECKTCPVGTFSTGQSSGCTDCRAGFFAPAGSSLCSPCKPGTYSPDQKAEACKLCPKGWQCPTSGMKRQAGCPRGTFSNRDGNKLCTPCPANTFSLGGSSTQAVMTCTKCDVGTSTRGLTGQSKCQVIRPQARRLRAAVTL